jgi:hypothetical protein
MFTAKDLAGRWVSESAEPIQNPDGSVIYGHRDFTLGDGTWALIFRVYADERLTAKLFSVCMEGTYELKGNSPVVQDAQQADFLFSARYFTPHVPMFVDLLNSVHAGKGNWQVDVEQDVSQTGALFIPSVAQASTEYDLLKLDNNKLFFGDRSQDLSIPANRPTQLIAWILVRQ